MMISHGRSSCSPQSLPISRMNTPSSHPGSLAEVLQTLSIPTAPFGPTPAAPHPVLRSTAGGLRAEQRGTCVCPWGCPYPGAGLCTCTFILVGRNGQLKVWFHSFIKQRSKMCLKKLHPRELIYLPRTAIMNCSALFILRTHWSFWMSLSSLEQLQPLQDYSVWIGFMIWPK